MLHLNTWLAWQFTVAYRSFKSTKKHRLHSQTVWNIKVVSVMYCYSDIMPDIKTTVISLCIFRNIIVCKHSTFSVTTLL